MHRDRTKIYHLTFLVPKEDGLGHLSGGISKDDESLSAPLMLECLAAYLENGGLALANGKTQPENCRRQFFLIVCTSRQTTEHR